MSVFHKTQVPLYIASFLAGFMILEFFFDLPALKTISSELQSWGVIVSAFALGIGVITVARNNYGIVKRREKNWPYFLWCLVAMFVMIGTGLIGDIGKHPVFLWLYNNAFTHLSSTMYSILAFFITTAAYRAFRARNVDAALVLIAGVFVILTIAPVGAVIWSGFPIIGQWFLDIPNMAGMRGIIIGVGLGVLALGVRTILGYERAHLGGSGGGQQA
jgi:nitrate reductase NapE component